MKPNYERLTGFRDFYPSDFSVLSYIFDVWRKVALRFGYEEYLGPLLEMKDLYRAKTGEEVVNEQLYSFIDRGEREVAIRPEMTPTVARMVVRRLQEEAKPIRWFSIANFLRYERPQHGREREFFQLNIDLFGSDLVLADLEILETAIEIMRAFGANEKHFTILINHRRLIDDYLKQKVGLSQDLAYQVRQILDKKDKIPAEEFEKSLKTAGLADNQIDLVKRLAELTMDELSRLELDSLGKQSLVQLFGLIKKRGLDQYCRFSPATVRGLDYYTGMVMEVFDLNPNNRRSLFGGGRYDDLLSIFGSQKLPAVGYAPGDVTTRDFLETHDLLPSFKSKTDVFVVLFDDKLYETTQNLVQKLRSANLNVAMSMEAEKLDKQFKYADKRGIQYVIVMGPEEVEQGLVTLKDLTLRTQDTLTLEQAIERLQVR